jgi:hypothetical protein
MLTPTTPAGSCTQLMCSPESLAADRAQACCRTAAACLPSKAADLSRRPSLSDGRPTSGRWAFWSGRSPPVGCPCAGRCGRCGHPATALQRSRRWWRRARWRSRRSGPALRKSPSSCKPSWQPGTHDLDHACRRALQTARTRVDLPPTLAWSFPMQAVVAQDATMAPMVILFNPQRLGMLIWPAGQVSYTGFSC